MGFLAWFRRLFLGEEAKKWARSAHAEERETALRIGLSVRSVTANWGDSGDYLEVLVPAVNLDTIGAVALTRGRIKTFVHRSSKVKGKWQASPFDGSDILKDTQYPSLQAALDDLRMNGFVVRTLMHVDGKTLS